MSGTAVPCVVATEEAGIRLDEVAFEGLVKAVAEDITIVFSRVHPLGESGSMETVGANVVVELTRATSFLNGKG